MSQTTPSTGSDAQGAPGPPGQSATEPAPGAGGHGRPTLIVALAVAVAVIIALIAALVWPDDSSDETATEPGTTEVPTTEAPTTAPSTAPSTTTPAAEPGDTATAVFPDPDTSRRFDDPVAAARWFAVDFVGFVDPVVGEFLQGDARSGEVEIRPQADGPATTVFVRQLGSDGTWWVLGSTTHDIVLDAPAAGDEITSPVALTGSALAFEGHVDVEVRQDGALEPIGTGFVTGGGDVARPFSGEVEFATPTAERGALVLHTTSAEDGRVWQAVVTRIAFG
jgi:Immunoglobulin-like domain of bacterial spore germination